jgi:hypothetical protein
MGSLEAILLIAGSTVVVLFLALCVPEGRRRTRMRP